MIKIKKIGVLTLVTVLFVTNTVNAAVIGNKSQKNNNVKVSVSAKAIFVGEAAKIRVSYPAKARKKKVTYKAAKGGIVSVKKTGSILGKKAGKAKVKVHIEYRIAKKKYIKNKQILITVRNQKKNTAENTAIPTVTELPIVNPYEDSILKPSTEPSAEPTMQSSAKPTMQPSAKPTMQPSAEPTMQPSAEPTMQPSVEPTIQPSAKPTMQPSAEPTMQPSAEPTMQPSTEPTMQPSTEPTMQPSAEPTIQPSTEPTAQPSAMPTNIPKPAIDVVSMSSNDEEKLEQLEVCPTELCGNDGCYVQPTEGMTVTYESGEQTYLEFAISGNLFHFSTDGITARKIPFSAISNKLSSSEEDNYRTKNVMDFYGDGVMDIYASCLNVKNLIEAFSGKKVASIQPSERMKAYIVKR